MKAPSAEEGTLCVCVCVCVCVSASGLSCGMQDLVAQPGRDPGPRHWEHTVPAAREVLDFVLWKKGGNRPDRHQRAFSA